MNNSDKLYLNNIGQLCRESRVKSGLSQTELSKIFGCSQNRLSKFESGQSDSAVLLFLYIAYLKNCRPLMDYLLSVNKELIDNGQTDEG